MTDYTNQRVFDHDDDGVVVVIGSGAGGGTLANGLARQGIKVVLLEAGGLHTRTDFHTDEWRAYEQLSWLDPRTTSGSWRVAQDFPNLPAWICKTVGGSTSHWSACSLRIQPHEFEARTRYGAIEGTTLLDWPIGYDDLAPYYDRAERRLNVTRTNDIPGLPGNNNFKVMYAGARKLGYECNTGRMAINSRQADGRDPCQQRGFCFQGCRSGAKWSTLNTEIPEALATGNCEMRTRAHVAEITHDASGKVTGVSYFDGNAELRHQKARVVAVAGNSIETPRLLLNSASTLFPDGLANGSGHVGKHYMRHMTGSVYAAFEQPVHMYRGTVMAGIIPDESRHDDSRGFAGGYEMETIALGLPLAAAFLNPGAWGRDFTRMIDQYDHLAAMWLVGEDMPRDTNRVTLNQEVRDQHGLPVANVHYDDHDNDVAMRNHAYRQGSDVYRAAGAVDVYEVPPYPSTHNLGTCRMSEKPEDGVCNGFGQTHEVNNLFIADGSQFTTSAAENPTLTIIAMAMRQAEHIGEQMKSRTI
ncbi:GMC family oxidoreductase [Salinicola corii]|uniref:GMC family oxidoreductase n=1 Tax=Salinicola corii TaxID=2606937 RepID=UPI001EF0B718|nr:GMC family oxidoreductase [Salinicola corii]